MADEGGVLVAAAAEGPHEALVLIDTLDVILSHLDEEAWKAARLVCRAWNDRALTNFYKDGRRLRVGDSGQRLYKHCHFLPSVDPRLLTSISLSFGSEILYGLLQHLDSSGNLGELRALKMSVDQPTLDYFIEVANRGGLVALREVDLGVTIYPPREEAGAKKWKLFHYRCKNLVRAGALPGLKSIRFIISNCGGPGDGLRENARPLPAVFQSFIAAAPNLTSLLTQTPLDLADRKVRKLVLHQKNSLLPADKEQTSEMLSGVSESLRKLEMCVPFPDLQFPLLPNLSTLKYEGGYSGRLQRQPVNLNSVPALRRINIPFEFIDWALFPALLPPMGKLAVIEITMVRIPSLGDGSRGLFAAHLSLLLNARVDRLTLRLPSSEDSSLSELLGVLETVEVVGREEEEGDGSRIVIQVFKIVGRDEGVFVRQFTALLEKLGRAWGLVRLSSFKLDLKPAWAELEVPLYGGQKQGRLRLLPRDSYHWYHLELEIKGPGGADGVEIPGESLDEVPAEAE